ETYLKDDQAMEDYLIAAALNDIKLVESNGTERAGNDILDVLNRARSIRSSIGALAQKTGNRDVIEQAGISGVFDEKMFEDSAHAAQATEKLAARLNDLALKNEKNWKGEFTL